VAVAAVRYPTHPRDFPTLSTGELRARFLVENLFAPGELRLTLSMQDRIVIGGAVPGVKILTLEAPADLRAEYFCERREIGVVCLSGTGCITVDGVPHELHEESLLYVGRGSQVVTFRGETAVFYLVSSPALGACPTKLVHRSDARDVRAGTAVKASSRTIRQYVHEAGAASSTLLMGITTLDEGSVWNTMPCHTHERRAEVYLYLGLGTDGRVFHLCGQPAETRTLVVSNLQAVISPPWSVHTGAGTQAYSFVWATAGENVAYDDMDAVPMEQLR